MTNALLSLSTSSATGLKAMDTDSRTSSNLFAMSLV
jgi:hypothetical protein